MIEIGQSKTVVLRKRDKHTHKLVPVLDPQTNEPLTKIVSSEVTRATRNKLGGSFGPDGKRRLVVKLGAGDVIIMWPQGTRQKVTLELKKVYQYALHMRALVKLAERARERKAAKQRQRESRRIRYAEHKLRQPIEA